MQVNEATQQLKTNNMKLKGLLNQVGQMHKACCSCDSAF